jgi:menaquinone-dependent protoporphyrinogen IX oxidase
MNAFPAIYVLLKDKGGELRMKKVIMKKILMLLFAVMFLPISSVQAEGKKGLLVYASVYGSTIETAYWIKAIIGNENHLDVKSLDQVITIDPYDYIIIGSLTRNEGPVKGINEFIETNRAKLAKKEVCYYLTCGDSDETMVLKIPGKEAHLIGGRNYLMDLLEKYPEIKPVAIAGFGGRQVMPTLGTKDNIQIWLVGKLAKEGAAWEGLDIWESLVVERVETFANEVRTKILGIGPRENIEELRGYWTSLQPASLTDATKIKYSPKPSAEHKSSEKIYYARSRATGDLALGEKLLKQWAADNGIDLKEQVKTSFNIYYHATKNYGGEPITTHIVIATFPNEVGNLQIAFRCWEKPDVRKGMEADITKAEELLWADGRKID